MPKATSGDQRLVVALDQSWSLRLLRLTSSLAGSCRGLSGAHHQLTALPRARSSLASTSRSCARNTPPGAPAWPKIRRWMSMTIGIAARSASNPKAVIPATAAAFSRRPISPKPIVTGSQAAMGAHRRRHPALREIAMTTLDIAFSRYDHLAGLSDGSVRVDRAELRMHSADIAARTLPAAVCDERGVRRADDPFRKICVHS